MPFSMEANMKTKFLLLVILFLFTAMAVAQTTIKKYDIKSGIVTFETTSKVGGMEMKMKSIVYFDDYGIKECKETYTGDKLLRSHFSDGKNLYTIIFSTKTARSEGKAFRGTEVRVDWQEFGTEKDRESGMIKKMPAMTVAGKTCEVYQTDDGKGMIATYAGWNKILLYLDVQTKGLRTTQEAVKVEENVKVPLDKFIVPAGYKIQ